MNMFFREDNLPDIVDYTYITIAGIKRSGSTWQANMVKFISQLADKEVWLGEEYDATAQAEVTINKIHPFIPSIAERSDYVFTSFRDIREVSASWERFRGRRPSSEKMAKWVEWLAKWNMYSDHMMLFGALRGSTSKAEVIQRTAAMLPFEYGELSLVDVSHEVLGMLDNIQPPEDKYYDEETCMFTNHITSDEFK